MTVKVCCVLWPGGHVTMKVCCVFWPGGHVTVKVCLCSLARWSCYREGVFVFSGQVVM